MNKVLTSLLPLKWQPWLIWWHMALPVLIEITGAWTMSCSSPWMRHDFPPWARLSPEALPKISPLFFPESKQVAWPVAGCKSAENVSFSLTGRGGQAALAKLQGFLGHLAWNPSALWISAIIPRTHKYFFYEARAWNFSESSEPLGNSGLYPFYWEENWELAAPGSLWCHR